jgi:hypothetical protein
MMKTGIFLILGIAIANIAFAQSIVFDPQQFHAATENGAARSGAESAHKWYLGKISSNLDNININMGSVVLAQTIIYEGLSNVNSVLKNGLAVKNMAAVIADMISYLNRALQLARTQPYLLLFASNINNEMRLRAFELFSDVSGYILNGGSRILADYNSRDQLLRKVTQQLQILDSLAYGAWKAMFWAKERGTIASVNPFAAYVNRDKIFVQRIISNAKYLR